MFFFQIIAKERAGVHQLVYIGFRVIVGLRVLIAPAFVNGVDLVFVICPSLRGISRLNDPPEGSVYMKERRIHGRWWLYCMS